MKEDNNQPPDKQFSVIIPCFNVASHLKNVLHEVIQSIGSQNVWVIDDGSTDATSSVANAAGVNILVHDKNRGKGAALKTGIRTVQNLGYNFFITMDGDEQHAPKRISHFIEVQQKNNADIVLGCRRLSLDVMPWDRILSNRISSFIISLVCKVWVPDSQCGYRLFRTKIFDEIELTTSHYETETEILFKTLTQPWKVSFCEIPTLYNSKISYINRFFDSLRFCKLLLRKLSGLL